MITRRLAAALLVGFALLFGAGSSIATPKLISPTPKLQFFDNNGKPLVGGKLFVYIAGTTTKVATYTDYNGGTPNANPVILNSRGEANVWLTPAQGYKFVLAPATDTDPPTNAIWTVDNINVSASGSIAYGTGAVVTTSSTIQSAIVTICVQALATNTQTLPLSPALWEIHTISDCSGNASTNPILVSGNGNNIDGFVSGLWIPFNWQSETVQWNGTIWKVE